MQSAFEMNGVVKTLGIILRIWLMTAVIFASGLFVYLCFDDQRISFAAFL